MKSPRFPCVALVATVGIVVARLPAQEPNRLATMSPLRALATGDSIEIETARRRLVSDPSVPIGVDEIAQLLRSTDATRRRAAGSVLLARGVAGDACRAWLDAERDPIVLEHVVAHLDDARLVALITTDPEPAAAPADDRVGIDHTLRMRVRALGALLDRGHADPVAWVGWIESVEPEFARIAARCLVEEVVVLPLERIAATNARARSALLTALADRPRAALEPWLGDLLATARLTPLERILALEALPAPRWSRDDTRGLLDALVAEDPTLRSEATRACALLTETQAERLVGEVHRRSLGDVSIDALLPALARIGANGERHLLGLARDATVATRGRIVEWLSIRRSPVLDEIVAEALDDRYPLTAELLMRAGGLLTREPRVVRVREILGNESSELGLRIAAFGALIDHGVLWPEMLGFALDPNGDPRSRVRLLVAMPDGALDGPAWRRVLAEAPHDVIPDVLTRMARVPAADGAEAPLLSLAATGIGLSDAAAHACLVFGRRDVAERAWNGLTRARRIDLVASLRTRRGEDWVVPALRSLDDRDGKFDVRFARIVAGDAYAFDELVAAPAAWPAAWLRRLTDEARAALTARHVETLAPLLTDGTLDRGQRREIVRWIAERPDVGATPLLETLLRDDADDEVRVSATRGLLLRPESAAAFRARVEAAIATGLDDELRDLGYEILGAMAAPLDPADCRFVARLALIAPLAAPEREVAVDLRFEPVADVALTNAIWQVAGREPSASLEAAIAETVDEALRHPDAACASRYRLGRLLSIFAREDAARIAATPIARLIVANPSLDPSAVGPAELLLSEAAERAADWAAAAEHARRAVGGCLRTPPEPMVMRAFVGDTWHEQGQIVAAYLTARPHVLAARAALHADDRDGARRELAIARELGYGDRHTQATLDAIEQELSR